ncbi:MAG: YihY/virulence factor BrkB family protein [Chloroflexota bacterium]
MKVISVVRELIADFGEDRGSLLAASIAYYTLLSIFPLILGLLALAGVFFSDPATRDRLVHGIASAFPGSETLILGTVDDVVRGKGPAGIVATLGLIWSASGVFGAMSTALNAIWRVPHQRNVILNALLAIGLVLAVGLVFVASLVLSTVLTVAAKLDVPLLSVSLDQVPLLFPLLSLALPLAITFAIFALIYRVVPNRYLGWRDVWPGAVLASALFEVSKQVFVVYLSEFAHLNAVYGSIGAVIALLIWSYYAAIVLLLGAELDAVLWRGRHASAI